MDTDRNLLFGVLALQADVISANQFVEACTVWAGRKGTELADLLAERGWLTAEDRADVERLVGRKLSRHGGDARAGLAEATPPTVRRALATVADDEVQASLAGLPGGDDIPRGSTTAYQPEGRGRYTLAHLHATGGIGRVWLARDADLGRDVALKELRPERQGHPAVVARFLEEARITGQLEHPGIVPVYELTRHAQTGQPFYTMRFLRGRTLTDALKGYHGRRAAGKAGPLELRELLAAFVAVCQAVAYAHSRGVLHRDLKPQNVVLGDFGEVTVLDWGLAKVVGRTDDSSLPVELGDSGREETVQGQVLGTPAYMAPEQAEGRLDRIDARSDVYGLGAILYEVLTGRQPFPGADTRSVLNRVVHEPPASPRALVPAAPAALEAVCLKALAKPREDRYGSAKDLASEVQHWLADEPTAAYAEPWTVKARRWLGRHQSLATAAAAAVVVAAVSLAGATTLLAAANDRERQARAAEEQAADREHQARERAETNFRLARQAVDGLSQVSDSPELKALAMEPLRRDLLGQARGFYEQLAQQQADEPGLQAERGRAYLRLADITEALGDRPGAIALARQAEHVFAGLSAADPEVTEYQDGLATALTAVGRNCDERKQYQAAREALERAVAIRQRLRRVDPGVCDYRFRLAAALNHLGLLYLRGLGRIPEGVAALEEARSLGKQLMAEAPWVPDYPSELARTLTNLGYLDDLDGNYARGVAVHAEAAALLDKLVQDHPRAADYQFRLARSLARLSAAHINLRQLGPAREAAARGVTVAEKLARSHPDVPDYTKYLALVRVNYAGALAGLGDHARAAAEVETAVAKPDFGIALYNGACTYCLCSQAAGQDPKLAPADLEKLSAKYLERAMALLGEAEQVGYFREARGASGLEKDQTLELLRQREDFKRLLDRARKQAGKGQ